MTPSILASCIDIVKSLVGHDYLYFDQPVEIKTTPHTHPFNAWAVSVSPKDDLYVMDDNEEWHSLSLTDQHASLVISTLYQRLKLMRVNYAKAS